MASAAVRAGVRRSVRGPVHPTWSAKTEITVAALRSLTEFAAELPVSQMRGLFRKPVPRWVARHFHLEKTTLGGVGAYWTRHLDRGDRAIVFYLHGGGYNLGSPQTYREMVARVARGTQADVVSIDYRLAPEHPFPAAVDDAVAAWIAYRERYPNTPTILGGDSAGGGLAFVLAQEIARQGLPPAQGMIAMSPWVRISDTRQSIRENRRFDYIPPIAARKWAENYVGDHDPRDPRISPFYGQLRGLPPVLMMVGGLELLRDDCLHFADRLRRAGVAVELLHEPNMVHVWPMLAGVIPGAGKAFGRMGRFCAEIAARTALPPA